MKKTLLQRICQKICVKFCRILPDRLYLRLLYRARMGKRLCLSHPQTFDEKLQWLKLYDRRTEYTRWADKLAVRSYVADRLGERYLIPLLGVWDDADQIKTEELPQQFVLKCTHDSASVCICTDKDSFAWEKARKKLRKAMRENYFYRSREWPYKDIQPKIIAEAYMTDESGVELKDYKVYTFGGEPYLIQVDFDRFQKHRRNLYSTEWEYIDEAIEYPKDPSVHIQRPAGLDEMLKCAKRLAEGTISLRVDFYSVDEQLYFGEITFYQEAGFAHFEHEAYAKRLGDAIVLPTDRRGKRRGMGA